MKGLLRDILPPLIVRRAKQVRRALAGPEKTFTVPRSGRRIVHRGSESDIGVLWQIFQGGHYDLTRLERFAEIQSFYDATAQPLILDCGAHIGGCSVWFATQFPRAAVIAVEPEESNFELLSQNVQGLNVDVVRGALAGQPGPVELFDPGRGDVGFRTIPGEGFATLGEVLGVTLDALAAKAPACRPFILKVDVEGAEAEVFREEFRPRTLDDYPVVIVELHDWMFPRSARSQPFLRWHVSQERDLVFMEENVFSLCNRRLPVAES